MFSEKFSQFMQQFGAFAYLIYSLRPTSFEYDQNNLKYWLSEHGWDHKASHCFHTATLSCVAVYSMSKSYDIVTVLQINVDGHTEQNVVFIDSFVSKITEVGH